MSCLLCKSKAIGSYSPDLDIKGLGFCKKHKKKVWYAYVILITSGQEEFKKFIKP